MTEHCVVLFASATPDASQKANTTSLTQLLEIKGVPYQTLDGAQAENRELRNKLFDVSGIRAKYPQTFACDVPLDQATIDSNWRFIGTYEDIHEMNEQDEHSQDFEKAFQNVRREK